MVINNGLIIQWGYYQQSGNENTVVYPITFSTFVTVIISIINRTARALWISNVTLIDFSQNSFHYFNEAGKACTWISIGY